MGGTVNPVFTIEDAPAAANPNFTIEDAEQPKPGFGQRFLESSGLSGIADIANNLPQSFSDLLSIGAGPAKQAATAAMAPMKHLSDIIAAHKAGDKEGVVSGVGKFIDSFIPGTGQAQQLSQETLKDIQEKNVPAVAGTATGLATQLALVRGLSKVGMTKAGLAKLAYTPEGELTPTARMLLHPTDLPETLFRKLVPEPAEQVAAREAFTNAKTIAEAQEAAAKMDAIKTRQAAAQARLAAKNAPKPSPFEGATSTSTPVGSESLPGVPQGNATPFPQVQKLSELQEAGKSRIVSPESAPPDVKVTYQSVPQAELLKKVKSGDLNAVREWQRRGLDLPPNVRFLAESAGTRPWRNLGQ